MDKNEVKIGQEFSNKVNGMKFKVIDIGFDSVWVEYENGVKDFEFIMDLKGEKYETM